MVGWVEGRARMRFDSLAVQYGLHVEGRVRREPDGVNVQRIRRGEPGRRSRGVVRCVPIG